MTKDEILALEARRFKAMCDGDAAALGELFHRDLTYTHSSGTVDGKDAYVGGVRDGKWDYKSVKAQDQRVAIYGTTAIIHCRLNIDVVVGGAPRFVDSAALSVWIEDGGRWQCVVVHSTPYPK